MSRPADTDPPAAAEDDGSHPGGGHGMADPASLPEGSISSELQESTGSQTHCGRREGKRDERGSNEMRGSRRDIFSCSRFRLELFHRYIYLIFQLDEVQSEPIISCGDLCDHLTAVAGSADKEAEEMKCGTRTCFTADGISVSCSHISSVQTGRHVVEQEVTDGDVRLSLYELYIRPSQSFNVTTVTALVSVKTSSDHCASSSSSTTVDTCSCQSSTDRETDEPQDTY